jgi:hypothetical protein
MESEKPAGIHDNGAESATSASIHVDRNLADIAPPRTASALSQELKANSQKPSFSNFQRTKSSHP